MSAAVHDLASEQFPSFMDADLGAVKAKIRQEMQRGVVGWDDKKCDLMEILYKRWMICAEEHGQGIPFVPTKDIDIFWHYHILHTRQYMADCKKYFGRYIHHNPHVAETSEMRKNKIISRKIFMKHIGGEFSDSVEFAMCFGQPDDDDDCSKCDRN